jgi:hypothetical protein
VLDFNIHPTQPDFTHAWLPEAEMDEVVHDGNRILVRSGDGLCLLVASDPFERVTKGPTAGCEVRLPGHVGRWIVRLSDIATEGSLEAFGRRFAGLSAEERDGGVIVVQDPDFGTVACGSDAVVRTEKETIDPKTWTLSGELTAFPEGTRVTLPSQHKKQEHLKIA